MISTKDKWQKISQEESIFNRIKAAAAAAGLAPSEYLISLFLAEEERQQDINNYIKDMAAEAAESERC